MPHALLSPVALGLELPPGINLFAWCMARQLDVSHRPWDVACRASPATAPLGVLYRMRRRGDRECGRIALTKQSPIATRRRSLSGSLAEMGMQGGSSRAGGGGQPRSSGCFLQLAILIESAGEPWRRTILSTSHAALGWLSGCKITR